MIVLVDNMQNFNVSWSPNAGHRGTNRSDDQLSDEELLENLEWIGLKVRMFHSCLFLYFSSRSDLTVGLLSRKIGSLEEAVMLLYVRTFDSFAVKLFSFKPSFTRLLWKLISLLTWIWKLLGEHSFIPVLPGNCLLLFIRQEFSIALECRSFINSTGTFLFAPMAYFATSSVQLLLLFSIIDDIVFSSVSGQTNIWLKWKDFNSTPSCFRWESSCSNVTSRGFWLSGFAFIVSLENWLAWIVLSLSIILHLVLVVSLLLLLLWTACFCVMWLSSTSWLKTSFPNSVQLTKFIFFCKEYHSSSFLGLAVESNESSNMSLHEVISACSALEKLPVSFSFDEAPQLLRAIPSSLVSLPDKVLSIFSGSCQLGSLCSFPIIALQMSDPNEVLLFPGIVVLVLPTMLVVVPAAVDLQLVISESRTHVVRSF